uniref:Uncharacterized protein n=1 Tax=Cacopsylla melanoneura TaxID=428564 RepID=A0A8D8TLT6_9HEMI
MNTSPSKRASPSSLNLAATLSPLRSLWQLRSILSVTSWAILTAMCPRTPCTTSMMECMDRSIVSSMIMQCVLRFRSTFWTHRMSLRTARPWSLVRSGVPLAMVWTKSTMTFCCLRCRWVVGSSIVTWGLTRCLWRPRSMDIPSLRFMLSSMNTSG